jgi:hypothetical protein
MAKGKKKPPKGKKRVGLPSLSKVEIEVIADPDGSGGIAWSSNIKTAGHGSGGKLKIPAGVGAKLEFELQDNTDLGVRFDASGPMFVDESSGGPCPSSFDSPQCMVDSCDAGELVVFDWNYGPACDLHYQLNFVTQSGTPVSPYDPIMQNGGGGTPPSLGSF